MEFEFNSRDRRGHHDTVRPIVFHASRAAEAGGHTPRTTVSPRIWQIALQILVCTL